MITTQFLDEIVDYTDNVIPAIDPIYKDYIPPAAARRMAKGIKMGVVASKIALTDAGHRKCGCYYYWNRNGLC